MDQLDEERSATGDMTQLKVNEPIMTHRSSLFLVHELKPPRGGSARTRTRAVWDCHDVREMARGGFMWFM